MGSFGGTCEIVESNEELDSVQHSRGNKMKGSGLGIDEKVGKLPMLKTGRHFSAENDINQIFEAIDRRTSTRAVGISHQSGCSTSKTVSKKPVRVSTSQASGIGISESASLKQALRGLRISHASEMAAMKRLSKPMGSPGVSESGALDRLYKAVVVDSSEGGLPLDDGEGNLVEFSLIPEKSRSNFCDEITECVQSSKVNSTNASAHSSPRLRVGTKKSVIATNTVIQDEIVPASMEVRGKPPLQKLEKKTNLKHGLPPSSSSTTKRVSEIEEIVPASTEFGSKSSILEHGQKGQLHSPRLLSSSKVASKVSKSASNSPRLVRPFVTNASTTRAQSHDEIIFLPASVDMGTSSKVSKSASNSPRIVKPFSVVRVTADKPSQTRTRPQYENVLLTTSLDMGISCNVSKSASNSPRMVKPFSVTRVTRDKPAQTRTHPQYENILLTTSLDMETTCKVSKSASNSPRMPKPFYVSRATTTTKPTTTTTKPTTTRVQPQDESILDSTTGGSGIACKVSKSASNSPRLVKPISGTNTPRSKPTPAKVQKQDDIVLESGEAGKRVANVKLTQKGKVKSGASSSSSNTIKEVLEVEDSDHSPKNFGNKELVTKLEVKGELCLVHLSSGSTAGQVSKSASNSPRVSKPIFRHKSFVKKKVKQDATSLPTSPAVCNGVDNDEMLSNKNNLVCRAQSFNQKSVSQEFVSPAASGASMSAEVSSSYVVSGPKKGNHRAGGVKGGERSRLGEKVEFSQSSKSSIGDYSTSTSISEDSSLSGSSSGNRPHMSKDLRWDAIHHVEMRNGTLGLRNFKLLKRLGCGDIGTVYLAELSGTNCLFALKVMDNEYLASRKKMPRAQTEREILQMLDHPFLPTLFAHFTTDKFSCLVMEFCPGGDLHVLRQKQTDRSFSEQAARFYVAEVLLALEYLHMLGVVYRDLKPENILVREDGHIMLSDFDLSLRCTVNPTLLKSSSAIIEPAKKLSGPCAESSCIDPFCLQPTWSQVSCFSPRIISTSARTRKQKADQATQVSPLPQLVAEPTSARSNSFVGTHEYLAPEIIKGEGHGSAVDWWTYGIFLYELLFGKTPFKGSGNEDTLANVVLHSLKFPESPSVSFEARDLIRGLLVKEPDNRLGSVKGATEIKQHPFFEGLNWALIRCAIPPELPKYYDSGETAVVCQQNDTKSTEFTSNGEHLEFELF